MIGRKKNNRITVGLISASIVLALLFTGFGYPGFMIPLIRKEQPEPVVHTTDQLLNGIPDTEPEKTANVLPAGNSKAFSITPQPGIIISAEENALDHDREFTMTPATEAEFAEFDEAIQKVDPDEMLLYAWDLDAGLAEDEILPGTFHVDLDLEELGIFEENYPYLSVYRVSDSGVWNEYAITIENGHLSFDSNKNCPITLTGLLGAAAAAAPFGALWWEFKGGTGVWLLNYTKMYVYENGVSNEGDKKNLGKKLYNVRVKFSETVEVEKKKLDPIKKEILNTNHKTIMQNIKKAVEEKYGKGTVIPTNDARYIQLEAQEEDKILNSDTRYTEAYAAFEEAVKKNDGAKPLDFSFYKKFGEYCRIANKYLKEQAKVIVPDEKEVSWYNFITNQVIDIYLNYDFKQGGATQFTTLGNFYVIVKGEPIMTGSDTTGNTLCTIIHELLHVSQREYRTWAKSNTKFDEATAQLIEFKAKEHLSEITDVSKENSNRWQTYFIPLDSSEPYIDGVKVSPMLEGAPPEAFGAGDQGYPLCHFIDHLLTNKKSLTFGELLTAYKEAGGFTPTLKTAFNMDDKELTKQYKSFIKSKQTIFYELALQWYTGMNTGNQWALSRKGFDKQGEHAVIKNQAYQTTVRKIYPQIPPDGRQKQVSVLLAYDDNYKELKDFELIPIGNKNYTNTKYGIMYDPKPYSTMKDLFTLEIDGGANTEDVTSGYVVWTLFAPKPIGNITLKDGMINFQLPEKSEAANAGKIDGYRVTITCTTDGTKTEKFYKISGAGKDISLNAKNYKDKGTKIEDAEFRVSVCEYIKEATGKKSFGPESDPTNSIVDDMEDTLEQMGAGHGKVNISLGWKTSDDLDLHVVTPNGQEIYYNNRSADGGVLDVDMQVSDIVASPAEHIDFATPPSGKYSVSVVNYTDRTEGADSPFVVVVEIEGKKKVYELAAGGDGSRTSVCRFTYGEPEGTEKGNEHLDD